MKSKGSRKDCKLQVLILKNNHWLSNELKK
jgi:hypothetical protein